LRHVLEIDPLRAPLGVDESPEQVPVGDVEGVSEPVADLGKTRQGVEMVNLAVRKLDLACAAGHHFHAQITAVARVAGVLVHRIVARLVGVSHVQRRVEDVLRAVAAQVLPALGIVARREWSQQPAERQQPA
jgi:hypothetical protein